MPMTRTQSLNALMLQNGLQHYDCQFRKLQLREPGDVLAGYMKIPTARMKKHIQLYNLNRIEVGLEFEINVNNQFTLFHSVAESYGSDNGNDYKRDGDNDFVDLLC
jgi:ketopantoate reductase